MTSLSIITEKVLLFIIRLELSPRICGYRSMSKCVQMVLKKYNHPPPAKSQYHPYYQTQLRHRQKVQYIYPQLHSMIYWMQRGNKFSQLYAYFYSMVEQQGQSFSLYSIMIQPCNNPVQLQTRIRKRKYCWIIWQHINSKLQFYDVNV